MKVVIYILFPLVIIFGCNSEQPDLNPPYDLTKLWEVHHQTAWDSLSTANHLIGKWKWNYSFCCGLGSKGELFTDDQNLIVNFYDNGKLEVLEKNISKQVSNWHLRIEDSDLYGIVATPQVIQLLGRMFITENGVLFDDAYRDGANNLFIRID